MKPEIQIFEHEQFGTVRVVIINGEPWFVAVDVCKALKLRNVSQSLSRLYDKEKQSIILPDGVSTNGVTNTVYNTEGITGAVSGWIENDKEKQSIMFPNGVSTNGVTNTVCNTDGITGAVSGWIENRVNVINEPGLYKLVLSSRKKEAVEFQDWVYYEVLPSIRKYGYYALVPPVNAPVVAKPAHVPNPNRVAGQHKDACVYVSAVNNGTVKFGQSCNVKARKANIQSVHKVKLGEPHTTSDFSRKIACLVEQACKDIFAPYRVEGEFFRVETDRAYRVVDALDKLITALPSVLEAERANKIFDALKTLGDTPETKALLLKAENIFVDKKPV